MGFITNRGVNEGVHIQGDGLSIDVVVKAIAGTQDRREALVEVRRNGEVAEQWVNHAQTVRLHDGVEFDISRRAGQCQVTMYYHVDRRYSIRPMRYGK